MGRLRYGVWTLAALIAGFGYQSLNSCDNQARITARPASVQTTQRTRETFSAEIQRYSHFGARVVLSGTRNGRYESAALVVSYSGKDTESDVIGLLDLRRINNLDIKLNPLRGQDVREMASCNTAPFQIYFTKSAREKIRESEILRKKLEGVFSPTLLRDAIIARDQKEEWDIQTADVRALLPKNPSGSFRFYSSPPRISPND